MFQRGVLLSVVALLSVSLVAQAPSGLSAAERALTRAIRIPSIQAVTRALADDAMEGRGTGEPGGERAANWLAAHFSRLGLKPLGDRGTFLQAVPFIRTETTESSSWTMDGRTLVHGVDWAALAAPAGRLELSGDLVFVGYGIVNEALHRNDLAGVDLTGKIAMVFQDRPANVDADTWAPLSSQRYEQMVKAGARAFVLIENGRSVPPVQLIIDYLSRPQFVTSSEPEAPLPTSLPLFGLRDSVVTSVFAAAGRDSRIAFALAERDDFRAVDLKRGPRIVLDRRRTEVTGYNVVGYLEGADPTLKAEAVVFSAHYDAYGRIRGQIYNGAADNAVGTAEMVAVAEAFSKVKPRPKRSLVFLATTSEEHGLQGSRYWAAHPTWNIERIAGNLNLDGIGTELFGPVAQVIGFGAEHSAIGDMLGEVLTSYGIGLLADPIPEEDVFTRSDHYAFVERGVPSLMLVGAQAGTPAMFVKGFKDWEARYYHQPSDDIFPTWHWPGAKTVADIMGVVGWRLAMQDGMPAWKASSPYRDLKRGHTGPLPPR